MKYRIFLIIMVSVFVQMSKASGTNVKNILIIYGSFSGSTAEIADSMKEYLESKDCLVTIISAEDKKIDLTKYDLILIGSAIREDKPKKEVLDLIDSNRTELSKKKVAVFAVCGTIVSVKENKREHALTYPDKIAHGITIVSKTVFAGKIPSLGCFGNMMGKMIFGISPGDFRIWVKIKEWTLSLINL